MHDLWAGRRPLSEAFWTYGLLYGTALNIIATIAALAVVTLGLPGALAVVIFVLPLPYVLVAVVGVFRSAGAFTGDRQWADAARMTILAWAMLMVIL
jgi:hypothetical protein